MHVVYAREELPASFHKSIFLAGPTPRALYVPSWREAALKELERQDYDGIVFVPEDREGRVQFDYTDQVEWEERCLHIADCILFWVPREPNTMPALTTNVEWGVWKNTGKVVFGAPPEAPSNRYLKYYAQKYAVPSADTLEQTVQCALEMIGKGAQRRGGECEVPLHIWRAPSFQNWYQAQKAAGNRLDGARVLWTSRPRSNPGTVFYWALHLNVFVKAEDRNKTNEIVISRPDISTVLLYKPEPDFLDTKVILIKEFRSPVTNNDCFVRELPGGSSFKGNITPEELAADEVFEETGFTISPDRLVAHLPRQLVATLSTHKAHFFSAEISAEELQYFESVNGKPQGNEQDSERTYVLITTVRALLVQNIVDWSTLGMIMSVVSLPG